MNQGWGWGIMAMEEMQMPLDRRQFHIALTVRHAQRRIFIKRLYGVDWYAPSHEVDRLSRRIFALIMRGWY